MTKRPSLGPETVVRKSRLATKGEAVPALVLERLSPLAPGNDPTVMGTGDGPGQAAFAAAPAETAVAAGVSPGLADSLMAALAERDRQIEALRAENERAAEHWSRERSELMSERDRLATELAASDATVDELRNRVADLRTELERSRKDMTLVMQQQAIERQQLLAHHRQELERLMVMLGRTADEAAAASETVQNSEPGMMPKARRWLFGGDAPKPDPKDLLPSPKILNRRPVS